MKPAVSVIVAAYNSEGYIERCLRSIQQQTLNNIQLVVVDDGSTDATSSIIDEVLLEDGRARILHQENRGVSKARNAGIDLAEGEYLFFCDSDDWLETDALEALYLFGRENQLDLVYFDHYRDENNKSKRVSLFPSSFTSRNEDNVVEALRAASLYVPSARFETKYFNKTLYGGGAAWRYLVRRQVVDSGPIRFDSYLDGMMEDALFTFDLLGGCEAIGYLNAPLYHYVIHGGSTIHSYVPDCQGRFNRVIDRMEQRVSENPGASYIREAARMRTIEFVGKMCEMNLCNPGNSEPVKRRYERFKRYVRDVRVNNAIKDVKLTMFANYKVFLLVLLLKLHLYIIYWIIKLH